MKRSKKVLTPRMRKAPLFGVKSLAVAVASAIATGCSFKEEVHIFKTVDEYKVFLDSEWGDYLWVCKK